MNCLHFAAFLTEDRFKFLSFLCKRVIVPFYLPISQSAFNSWIPPFPGLLQQQQQQAQVSGRPQFPLSTLESFAGLFPNQIPFSRQVGFAQGGQAGQPDFTQQQTPSQTQQSSPVSEASSLLELYGRA